MKLKGRKAVVTGASGSIGEGIAQALWKEGCHLLLSGRTDNFNDGLFASKKFADQHFSYYQGDLTISKSVFEFKELLEESLGEVDILIHSAGAFMIGLVHETEVDELDRMYKVNIRVPYQITRLLLPALKRTKGQIAFINSSSVFNPRSGLGKYAASKSALRAFTNSLRDEVNPHGIRVVSIFPGRTASKMQEYMHNTEKKEYKPEKLIQPEDIAMMLINTLTLPKTCEVTDIHIRPFQKY